MVDRALTNGVIDRGVRLSETQKTELINEAGKDISTDLYNNGYVLQINDATAAVRQARISPSMSFWYTYGSVPQDQPAFNRSSLREVNHDSGTGNITSANAQMYLVVDQLYPAGVPITNFSADP